MTRTDQERRRGESAQMSSSSPQSKRKRRLMGRSVRTRVAALVLLPLIATVILGASVVQNSLDEAAEAIPAEHLTKVGVEATEVSRRLRDERFITIQAALEPNDSNVALVDQVRAATDASVEEFFEAREPMDSSYYGYDIANQVRTFEWKLADLEEQRDSYDSGTEDAGLIGYHDEAAQLGEQVSISATNIVVRQNDLGPTLVKAVDGAQDAASRARLIAIVSIAFVGVVLAFTVIMTVVVARSIIGPLRRLRAAALDTAKSNLPALVDRIRRDGPAAARQSAAAAEVEGEDEIAQVATAFNDVHATAVQVAGEQALLRQNLDTIVVNLSRRTQSLIDRQLGELEGLESRERDPDQLSTLFRIDHMATRVRRHADSLLILAGVDEMRKQVPASPVLDVVRGAVGEVEQYPRVEFGVMPADLVVATAVHDTAHLLAELIDNATEFSAPSTPVTVTSQPLLGGGLRIQVTDTGLGIPPDQLTELNNRLNSPGDIDVAASRTLGLYVVARLANKHAIQVRLEPATTTTPGASGTVAQIDLPSTLILSPLDTTENVVPAIQDTDVPASGYGQHQALSHQQPATAFPEHNVRPPAQPVRQQRPLSNPAEPPHPHSPAPQQLPRRAPAQPVMNRASQVGPPAGNGTPPVPPKPTDTPAGIPGSAERTSAGIPGSANRTSPPVPASVAPLTAREQTYRGSSLNVPKPDFPKSDTPVYDAMRSAWFNKGSSAKDFSSAADEGWRRAAEARRAAEVAAAAADTNVQASARRADAPATQMPSRTAKTPVQLPARQSAPQTRPAERKRTPAASLWSQADQQPPENRPSQAPQRPDSTEGRPAPAQSQGGLPVRQKGASLLPGSISTPPQATPDKKPTSQPPVDVKHVASTLSSLQRGVSRGREETGGWVPKRPTGQGSAPKKGSDRSNS